MVSVSVMLWRVLAAFCCLTVFGLPGAGSQKKKEGVVINVTSNQRTSGQLVNATDQR
jgi:hypothetical protein